MKNYLKIIGVTILGISCGLGALIAHANEYPAQLGTFQVIGSGIAAGSNAFTLNSFNDIYGNTITMAYFGTTGYGTLEPGNGSQEEAVSFTSITNNANGTVTLGGVNDTNLSYPFATTTNPIQINHAGGVTFTITNTAAWYYSLFPIAQNPSVITNTWTFASTTNLLSTSTASTSLVNYGELGSLINNATSSLLSSNNTWTGTNTFNTTVTFAGTSNFNSSLPTSSLTPTLSNQLATKAYIDGVAIAGGVTANNTTTGISRIASSTQISTGYSSTTSSVIPSSLASSTASTTSIVVATIPSDGKIDPSFLNGAGESYTFNGNTTFNGNVTLSSVSLPASTKIGTFPAYQIIGYATSTSAVSSVSLSFATSTNLRVEINSVLGADQYGLLQFNSDAASHYGFYALSNGLFVTSASSSAATAIRFYCGNSGGASSAFFDVGINNSTLINPKQVTENGSCLLSGGNSIVFSSGIGMWIATGTQISSLSWSTDSGNLGTTTITVYGTPNQ